MAEIGDKVFTTDMIQLIKDAVKAELGTNAYVNRYLAEITAVNTTTSEVSVKLSGSDTASDSFRVRGIHLPEVGQQVVACIDGQDRWIESVIRPTTSTPYFTFDTAAAVPTGAIVAWLTTTAPTGWLFCDGTTKNYNDYPELGALRGGTAGGTFTVPNLQDRFIAGNSSVTSAWSNNSGTFAPTSRLSDHSHSFTGDSHSHDIAHGHADNISVGAHGDHTHTVNPAATSSGTASVGAIDSTQFAYIASGATYRAHTHSTDIGSTTSSAESANLTHTVSGGVTNLGSTQSVATTATGTNSVQDWTTAEATAKASLLNFIIKT
jgi:microcystin-dependent protein